MIGLDLCVESGDVEGLPGNLVVHPRAGFGKIGETDSQVEQRGELVGLMSPGGDPDLMQRTPEAVAGMGVVVADAGGSGAGRRADEDEAKVGAELIGQTVGIAIGHVNGRNATC